MQVEQKQQSQQSVSALCDLISVYEFSRRHRLDLSEEQRLRKIFGNVAPMAKLLATARRQPFSDW